MENKKEEDREEQKNKNLSEDIIPEEVLEAFPEEDRGRIESVMRQTIISGAMHRGNPIADKITSEHITQLITKSDDQDKREWEERGRDRNYNLILVGIGVAFVSFLVVFLKDNENLLLNLVLAIVSFIGGFGFGKFYKSEGKKS